jgi:hypothetical protein
MGPITYNIAMFAAYAWGERLARLGDRPGSIGYRPAAVAPGHYGFFAKAVYCCSQPRYIELFAGTGKIFAFSEMIDRLFSGRRGWMRAWEATCFLGLMAGEALLLTWLEATDTFPPSNELFYRTIGILLSICKPK